MTASHRPDAILSRRSIHGDGAGASSVYMAITTRLALIVISAFRLLSEYESRAGTEKNIVLAKIGLRKASGERSTSCSLLQDAEDRRERGRQA